MKQCSYFTASVVEHNIVPVAVGQETWYYDNDKRRTNMRLPQGTACLVNTHVLMHVGGRLRLLYAQKIKYKAFR